MGKLTQKSLSNDSIRLKKLRMKLNMTQRLLAAEFYVSPGAIALWENGDRQIPGPVRKLIEIYGRLAGEDDAD